MLGSKQRTYGMYIRFLSTLGVYVALFCIISHLAKTGIYRREFDIYTVDILPNWATKTLISTILLITRSNRMENASN